MTCPICQRAMKDGENPCARCRAYLVREQIGPCSVCGRVEDLRFGRCMDHVQPEELESIEAAIRSASVVVVIAP